MSPIRTITLTAAATLVASGLFAVPALADGPPQIGSGGCYQTVYASDSKDNKSRFQCDYYVTGGTGTVTAAYYGTLGVAHSSPTTGGTIFSYAGVCSVTQQSSVLARFTDSTGAQASQTDTFTCSYY